MFFLQFLHKGLKTTKIFSILDHYWTQSELLFNCLSSLFIFSLWVSLLLIFLSDFRLICTVTFINYSWLSLLCWKTLLLRLHDVMYTMSKNLIFTCVSIWTLLEETASEWSILLSRLRCNCCVNDNKEVNFETYKI